MESHAPPLAEHYPNVAWWTANQGWIEVGWDGLRPAFVRAIDQGGAFWEGERTYPTLEDAFTALDEGVRGLIKDLGLR